MTETKNNTFPMDLSGGVADFSVYNGNLNLSWGPSIELELTPLDQDMLLDGLLARRRAKLGEGPVAHE
jgi:hypothetical protein